MAVKELQLRYGISCSQSTYDNKPLVDIKERDSLREMPGLSLKDFHPCYASFCITGLEVF